MAAITAPEIDGDIGAPAAAVAAAPASHVSILANGIKTFPRWPHVMEAHSAADKIAVRAFSAAHGIFDGINMSLDWKERVWEMIQAAVAWVPANFHWIGVSPLGGRPIEMLNTLDTDASLLAWGSTDPSGVVAAINALSPAYRYTMAAVGTSFAVALKNDGTLYSFGTLFGTGEFLDPSPHSILGIAAAGEHGTYLLSDGTVKTFQTEAERAIVDLVSGVRTGPFDSVATGLQFSVGLKTDGTVEVWGNLSTDVAYNTAWDGHIVQITAAGGHIVALLDDGTVVAWGENGDGQCTVPSLSGKDVLNIFADASRSYVAFELSNGNKGIQAWGRAITIGDVASNKSGFGSSSMNYIISPSPVLPQIVTLAGDAGDMPVGALPSLPADTSWVDFAGGDRFGVGIANRVWSCGAISRILQGILAAEGICCRHVNGVSPDLGCASDRIIEIFCERFNDYILVWPQSGNWVEDVDGRPLSYAKVREHHNLSNYEIVPGWEVGRIGRGHKAQAVNGSGLQFKPSGISTPRLFPHDALDWWSTRLKTVPGAGDLFDFGQTTSDSKVNSDPMVTTTVYFQAINACSLNSAGQPIAAETSYDITYPLNNVVAEAIVVSEDPATVQITLVHNMVAGTGGFDHFDAKIDVGEWAEISTLLTDEGGGIYTWLPVGSETARIRGVNGAGVHSPDVIIRFSEGAGRRRLLMGVGS